MGIAALLREQANSKPVLRSHHRPQQARGESHTNSHNAAPAARHTQGLLLLRHLRLGFSEAGILNESLVDVVESHIESLVLGQIRPHNPSGLEAALLDQFLEGKCMLHVGH